MSDGRNPDPRKMCHHTGFKRSCKKLLDSGACQGRWVEVSLNNLTKEGSHAAWGCSDEFHFVMGMVQEKRLLGIQAAVEMRGNAVVNILAESMARQERQHAEAVQMVSQQPAKPVALLVSSENNDGSKNKEEEPA